jgi:hypothetical protein
MSEARARYPWSRGPGLPATEQWARRWAGVLAVWFLFSLFILAIVHAWGVVSYVVAFCGLFGGAAWILRSRVRPALRRLGLDGLGGFLLLAVAVSTGEEMLIYLLAGPQALAIHQLGLDLLWIDAIWLGWMLPWFVWVSRRFAFGEVEALVVGSSTGVLFEVVLSRVILAGPLALVWVPLGWVVYATVFLLPLQLVDFPSASRRTGRLPLTLGATWGSATAVALGLYVLFAVLGLPT